MPPATLLRNSRTILPDGSLVCFKVWLVPEPVPPCRHRFKYSLFYGKDGHRLVGYDNERGKGDHKHILGIETPYAFVSETQLIADFLADVKAVREQ